MIICTDVELFCLLYLTFVFNQEGFTLLSQWTVWFAAFIEKKTEIDSF